MRWLRVAGLLLLVLVGACSDLPEGDSSAGTTSEAVDFDAGAISGSVSWNGAVVSGVEQDNLFALLSTPANAFAAYSYLSSGSYSIPAVAPGAYALSVFQNGCNEGGLLGQRSVAIVAAQTADGNVDISATAGRVIGTITVNGSPVPYPELSISGFCGTWGRDSDGSFGHFMPPGSYTATVRVGTAGIGSFDFVIVAGETTDLGAVDFSQGAISGSVSWNGAVVSGVEQDNLFALLSTPANAFAAYSYLSSGSYSIPAIAPGAYALSVYQNGCNEGGLLGQRSVAIVAAQTADGNVDISATAGRVIGTITVNGSPVPYPELSISGFCGTWGRDSDGRFGHFMPPGSYTATVRVGTAGIGSFDFVIVAGETTDLGAVDFSQGAISGSVSWNGPIVSGVEQENLFALLSTPANAFAAYSYLSSGSYSIPAVAPGAYALSVYQNGCNEGGLLGQRSVAIVAAQTADGNVDISATAGRVIGTITVNGSPVPYPEISIPGLCGTWGRDPSGGFGHFLPGGFYTATVRVDTAVIGTFDFDIVVGQTTDVDIGTTLAGSDVGVELSGGIGEVGGISLLFSSVLQSGQTTVVESGAGAPPDTGFRIVGLSGQPRYWDIDTTAGYSGPITVCIHYDPDDVQGNEANLQLRHDDGSGWDIITTSLDTDANIICGEASSLSPFAVFEPIDGDADGDGVADSSDACAGTPAAVPVDGTGCSVAQLCPCHGRFSSHGAYVSCVTHAVSAFVARGSLELKAAGRLVSQAARSGCGR